MQDSIEIQNASEHNLKNVSLSIPHKSLTVFSGVSGSGKSSLAFDTIFKEGQRRYLESLSSYARQFLGVMSKASVDHIEGLSPTISIDQKSVNKNPRSTVGTVTEIYDFMRLLFARLGTAMCPNCGEKITKQTEDQITRSMFLENKGEKVMILAPIVRDRKGEYRKEIADVKAAGYLRLRVDGNIYNLADTETIELKRYEKHTLEIVIDRLKIEDKSLSRITEAVEKAALITKGLVSVFRYEEYEKKARDEKGEKEKTKMEKTAETKDYYRLYTTERSCASCGHSIAEIEPNLFSFNNPMGACEKCGGLGVTYYFSEKNIIEDESKTVYDNIIKCFTDEHMAFDYSYNIGTLEKLAKANKINLKKPWKKFSMKERDILLYSEENPIHTGIAVRLEFLYKLYRIPYYERFMEEIPCDECGGSRLNKHARAVLFENRSIDEYSSMSVSEAYAFFSKYELKEEDKIVGEPIIKEIIYRLRFLNAVGLSYININRSSPTLSGGESQRIRLAAQIGSGLEGVLYVLDEPSIGLHQSDNKRLLNSLKELRDRNNTVIVVEHDLETIESADYLVDIGPKAGIHGGEIVAIGTPEEAIKSSKSITARYLRGDDEIPIPKERRKGNGEFISILGATHFNLKNIDVNFPLGTLTAVTGLSGSGKSTLIDTILKRALSRHFYNSKEKPGKHKEIKGIENIDKVIEIDQSPIGRTPRSNPATYSKVLDPIRELFANTTTAKMRGYTKSRFSFNVVGGRCETCKGAGVIELEMQFLSNVLVPCEECNGRRFNEETLDVEYKGKNINDVLNMSVSEALDFFENIPKISKILTTLQDVGLDYVKLGQTSPTLSGGEAQRLKLASELRKTATGKTLYLLDEPTTGLHFEDIKKLLIAIDGLVDKGNTVIIIEHNLDIIKRADHIIDLGPEGGEGGGRIIAIGTPEEVAANKESATGKELKEILNPRKKKISSVKKKKSIAKKEEIKIIGAKKHNLKNISLRIPKNTLTVISGLSGSGKTSLAFDTIFNEGQRRFVESLSTYARRFLGRFEDANVEKIEGLSPAIAIDQKNVSRNPRSTVATVTEIYDYMRLIFARIGKPHCPVCDKTLKVHSPSSLAADIIKEHPSAKLLIIAPLYDNSLKHRFTLSNEDAHNVFSICQKTLKAGYMRVIINNKDYLIEEIDKAKASEISKEGVNFVGIVIDRIIVDEKKTARISDALEQTFSYSEGVSLIQEGDNREYYTRFPACLEHGFIIDEEITPRHFSFNSHWGYCPECKGLGYKDVFDINKAIIDETFPISAGVLDDRLHKIFTLPGARLYSPIKRMLKKAGIDEYELERVPYYSLSSKIKNALFFGYNGEKGVADYLYEWRNRTDVTSEDYSEWYDNLISSYLTNQPCESCGGQRLNEKVLSFKIDKMNISEMCSLSVSTLLPIFTSLPNKISRRDLTVAEEVISEIEKRLSFLERVGLNYISLERKYSTLSGGEAQRIRLAGQLGSRLTGVLYVLDEPTVGLHPRDTSKLLDSLVELKDLGNTLIVVEHDKDTIKRANNIIEMGPKAGEKGGEVVFNGSVENLLKSKRSLSAKYLNGEMKIYEGGERRKAKGFITITGAKANNLKNIDVSFPIGVLTTVSGVSGSGKSSLVVDTLYPIIHSPKSSMANVDSVKIDTDEEGVSLIQKVILVDQYSIQGSIRSSLISFLGCFDAIRNVFAKTPAARAKGFIASRFTYNNREGRCRACEGHGVKKVSMHFLSDLEIVCDACKGKRYNEETLSITYKSLNIAEVLELTVSEAARFFSLHKKVFRALKLLKDVGLGYLKLGQRLDTLSGGELQRLKLSRELARTDAVNILYILDEPTTGLHFDDIKKLLQVLNRLVDKNNTCILIEHHPDIIKASDYVIDMGKEGGDEGGKVIAKGTPEEIALSEESYTGKYL